MYPSMEVAQLSSTYGRVGSGRRLIGAAHRYDPRAHPVASTSAALAAFAAR